MVFMPVISFSCLVCIARQCCLFGEAIILLFHVKSYINRQSIHKLMGYSSQQYASHTPEVGGLTSFTNISNFEQIDKNEIKKTTIKSSKEKKTVYIKIEMESF